MMHRREVQWGTNSVLLSVLFCNQPTVKFLMQTVKPVRIREYRKVSCIRNIVKMSVKIVLFKDPGIIRKAVDHLFYSIEETPDRYFLMQVNSVADT
jgi:hypothetical protein